MQESPVYEVPDIKMTVFGRDTPAVREMILCEMMVSAAELADGRFESQLGARAMAEGWVVTHLCRRAPRDEIEYQEKLQLAAEFGAEKAKPVNRVLLERFLTGEVTEDLLLALGRTVRERSGHPATEFAIKAAERDVYRVFWRLRLGPVGALALTREAETWAEMALDWRRAEVTTMTAAAAAVAAE